ncbi:MAG: hypothetical protein ACOCXA_02160 [Planctomycetota bacterium]
MDLKQFLIRRGEWIFLAVVLVFSVVHVLMVVNDETALPAADAGMIRERILAIEDATSRPAPRPEPRKPEDSLVALRYRLEVPARSPRLLQWFNAHPNIFEAEGDGPQYLYAYRTGVPSIAVDDDIGTFQLRVELPSLPDGARGVGRGPERLAGPGPVVWRREVPGVGEVVNRAHPKAVEFSVQVGHGDWRPVSSIGDMGLRPVQEDQRSIAVELSDIQPMQEYKFRARVLYAATARLPDAEPQSGQDVVVYNELDRERIEWRDFAQRWQQLGELAEPVPDLAAPLQLDEREHLLAGEWSEPVALEAKSDVRIGLKSVSENILDGTVQARFLIRKLLRDLDGAPLGWTPATRDAEFRISTGEELGGRVVMRLPWVQGRDVEVDLTTDLVLQDLEKVERVENYELRKGTLENGERGVVVKINTDEVYQAVLENKATGKQIRILQLGRIRAYPNRIYYPEPMGTAYLEIEALEADDPSAYQPPVQVPTAPIEHAPDSPLLRELNPLARTNVPYYELADGRVVYYDTVNNDIFIEQRDPQPQPETETEEADDGAETTEPQE